jgi:tetratricopeptide (TPR) repeat protein
VVRILVKFFVLLMLVLGVTAPGHAEWRVAVSPHFEVYSEGPERSLRAYSEKVERIDSVMRRLLSVPDTLTGPRLKIYLLETPGDVGALKGQANVAGFYVPRASGSFAVSNRETRYVGKQNSTDTTLFHEYAHHFMFRYATSAYPGWFIEGFAEFYSTIQFDKEGKASIGVPPYNRGYELLVTKPVGLEVLLGERPAALKGEAIGSYYGRAWLLTHYLFLSGERKGQLVNYLKAIQSGTPALEAARTVFGDLAKLDADLDRYLKQRRLNTMVLQTPIPAASDVVISTLSAADSAFIRLGIKAEITAPDKRPTLLAELKAQLTKYPSAASGWVMLADAHYEGSAFDEAIKAADTALTLNPKLSRAMLIKGQAMIRALMLQPIANAADWTKARSWIIRANRADVDDPLPLLAYYESWQQQGVETPEISLTGLGQAYKQAPEDRRLRMTYAMSLVKQMKYSRAVPLIESVLNNPHSNGNDAGVRLIAKLRSATDGEPLSGINANDISDL